MNNEKWTPTEWLIALTWLFAVLALCFSIVALARTCHAAEATVQKDPIFKNNNGSAKDNLIVRDASGRVVGYWIKDPILKDNWIQYRFKAARDDVRIYNDGGIRIDLDPVGE